MIHGISYVQYLIAWFLFFIGRCKWERAYDLIVYVFVIALSINYLTNVPFQLDNPRQYVLRSAIIAIRCSTVIALFGINGVIDFIIGLLAPLIVVLVLLPKTEFPPGSIKLAFPAVVVASVGCGILDYIVAEEQRRLFSNEVAQRAK